MGKQKTQYKIVGRYVKGNEAVGYEIESDTNKRIRCTDEQLAFIVGKGQVTNAKAQLSKGKMILRGVNCDLRKLPTIQLNDVESTKVEKSKADEIENKADEIENKAKVEDSKAKGIGINTILKIDKYIDKILNTNEYEMVEHCTLQKQLVENKLFITLTEDKQYCGEANLVTEYIIEERDSNIVVINNNDKNILCKSNINSISEMIRFLLSCLCIINKQQHSNIIKADRLPELYSQAFEDYSGASNNIDDILRDADEKFADEMFAPYSMIHAALMNKVYNHNKLGKAIYSGYLFRGERGLTSKSRVENSFSSLTYSIETAYQFANTKGSSRILAFKDLKMSDLVEIGEIAIAITNEEASEQEVLLRSSVQIDVHNKIGEYKGIPIYLATARVVKTEDDERDHLIQAFMKEYNNDCIYGVGQVLRNIGKISNIEISDDCEIATIYTRKANKFSIVISDTDKFIVNGKEIKRSEIDSVINSII